MLPDTAADVPTDNDHAAWHRAVRFFWVVLIAASAASIAGNAAHAVLKADTVSPSLAAAVATAPPLVLLACTEGLSRLIKVRRRATLTYWLAVTMTVLVAGAAFRLSFDALCDLAIRCGISRNLAYLWPLVVDVTITQATLSLLTLTRTQHSPAGAAARGALATMAGRSLTGDLQLGDAQDVAGTVAALDSGSPLASGANGWPESAAHERAARAVVESKRTKQPAEVVAAVLQRHAAGRKPGEIADEFDLHHSTVSRIVATALHSPARLA